MSILAPEFPSSTVVGHKDSQTVCRVVCAVPVGYRSWLYTAVQVADASKVHECLAGGLVRMATGSPSTGASPASEAATASERFLGSSPRMQSPPSGVLA